jgi:alpha-amylase
MMSSLVMSFTPYRQIADRSLSFGLPFGSTYTLAFSRLLYGQEILVAYNVSSQARSDCIIVDANLHRDASQMTFLYGRSGSLPVQSAPTGARFVQVDLAPNQFAILA